MGTQHVFRQQAGAQPRRRGRPLHDSSRTREALMDAGEELFATFGVEGVSLRSIEAAAGVSPAVLNYHFHSKDGLLEAIITRRGETVAKRMTELLDALEARSRRPTPRDVVKAIALPFLEMLDREPVDGLRWTRLIARLVLGQNACLQRLRAMPGGAEEDFSRFARWAFPGVPEPRLERAWRISYNILMLMLGTSDARFAHGAEGEDNRISQPYVDTLIDFVASGFTVALAPERSATAGQAIGSTMAPRAGRSKGRRRAPSARVRA
jgi:AcrR family transcriptional regulator